MAKAAELPFPSRTARFRQVVARCGRPEVHLSLVAPNKDRVLQDLKRRGRVMTIRPAHRGGGADYGVIGLLPERGVQILIFDRSLRAFAGRRIVGIDYSLLKKSPPANARERVAPRPAPVPARTGRGRRRDREPPKPAPRPEPASPPDAAEIRNGLRQIQRLLAAGRHALARERVGRLVERMGPDG